MTRTLVTGASGFIGAALVAALPGAVRTTGRAASAGDHVMVGDLSGATDWTRALDGVSAIVHLASPAHARFTDSQLRTQIVDATAALAHAAETAGVTRFVYLSSIKATAARTARPVSETDAPKPADAYGRAKMEAEQVVLAHPALNPIALRPPLVFAPGARANFARLLQLAASGAPLPLAGIANKRSLIARASLIEAIKAALAGGPSGIFHVADQPAPSTAEIVSALRRGIGLPPRLTRAPLLAALLPGQLRDSLEVDDSVFRAAFGYGACSNTSTITALEACAAAWKPRA